MPKRKLTAPFVEKAKCPPGKGYEEYHDENARGLTLKVTEAGGKIWSIRYRAAGKYRRFKLGEYPSLSLSAARDDALDTFRDIRKGRDPQRERITERTKSAPSTVSETLDSFIQLYSKPKNRSWKEVEQLFEREVKPIIGKWPLEDVTRSALIDLLDKIKAPSSANKTYRYLSRFFRWCLEKDYLEHSPMDGVKLPRGEVEISRDRVLSEDELIEIWNASDELGYPFGTCFKLLILLGQRRDEVATMRWQDLDLDKKNWSIPAAIAKNKKAHEVPLSPKAISVLENLPRQKSPYLFTTTLKTPISGFSKVKSRTDKLISEAREKEGKIDIPAWRIHDFRRTVASGLAALATPQIVIERIQNRATGESAGVASVYNRFAYDKEKRAALEAWSQRIERLTLGADEEAKVIPFHSGNSK